MRIDTRNAVANSIARDLVDIGCVRFDFATGFRLAIHVTHPLASRSPFYLDLRVLRSFPTVIRDVSRFMVAEGREFGLWDSASRVSDVPTAATPIVTLISQETGIPMISPRLAAKGHGIEGGVIGTWEGGMRAVLIDDLRTTGGSKEEVIALYEYHGLKVEAVYVLVDRGSPEGAPVAGRPCFASFLWSLLLTHYERRKIIGSAEVERCARYPALLAAHLASCGGCA